MRVGPGSMLLMMVLACGESLDQATAGRVVIEHLRSAAPLAVVQDSFRVNVAGVTEADRGVTAVRFRAVWAYTDTAGARVDTSGVLTAYLSRTGGEWAVRRYDDALLQVVTGLVDEDLRRVYADLLDAAHHVYHVMTGHGWYYNESGIPPDEVRRLMEAEGAGHGGPMSWGLTPPGSANTAQIVWSRDGGGAQCALPITRGALRPPEFAWVRDAEFFTCRGRTATIYERATLADSVRARVAREGVLPARR